jgi:ectoine hydroxylase-related dioxygenase (phytanoyl-CoA dioxygenase family)
MMMESAVAETASSEPVSDAMATLAEDYQRDGYIWPLDLLSVDEAKALRDDLEAAEAELAGDAEKSALLQSYPDRLLPSFHQLTRHPTLIAAAEAILGPDIIVYAAQLFTKEAKTPHIVSWHQDLTYWGLSDLDEITCWVALSPATSDSGCMRFVPGTHREQIVAHVDTFNDYNLLTRGQEIAVKVDESDAVTAELKPGQTSIHHGHLFHASGPNSTADRRIGFAIRYITPTMAQETGERTLVTLVKGEDRHNHFKLANAPEGRLSEADFERCRVDAKLRRRILYAGADSSKGKRYQDVGSE